jgi:hypothetical protein
MVMVVSFNASAARLSHEDANAGTAGRHARTHIAHFIVGIFIWASNSSEYTPAGREPTPVHFGIFESQRGAPSNTGTNHLTRFPPLNRTGVLLQPIRLTQFLK